MRKLLLFWCVFLLYQVSFAQSKTVSGRVTDTDTQTPIPGVSIVVKGQRTGVTSSSDGTFSLTIPSNARVLVFSSVGFSTKEINIGNSTEFNVTLGRSETDLEGVVITGYTKESRSKYSGAASKVTSEKINNVPVASIDQILQGRAPGVFVGSGSGQPGANATVLIRGVTSISGINQPLYIMDGIPIEPGVFQSLNPSDIETVDVLRDATSTALYGSRGAAGVIVITTKKGKSGRTIFSLKTQTGFATRSRPKFTMMNSEERIAFEEQIGLESGLTIGPGWYLSRKNPANASVPAAELAQYDRWLDSLRNSHIDWTDIYFRTGRFQEHEVSASGGSDKTRFYTSFNYYKEQGISLRSDLERYSVRTNVDFGTNKFTGGINMGVGFTRRNFIENENTTAVTNPFASVYYALPYEIPYVNGKLIHSGNAGTIGGVFDQREGSDGLERMEATTQSNNQLKGTLSGNFKLRLMSFLSLIGTAGIDFRETILDRQIKPGTRTGGNAPGGRGSLQKNYARNVQVSGNGGLNFNHTFAERHSLDVTTLVEALRDWGQNFGFTGYGIDPLRQGTPAGVTAGSTTAGFIPVIAGNELNPNRAYVAFIGIGKYTFDNKYTLNMSYRYDGATQVPAKNRWKGFYSAGVAWNATEEKFLANSKFIDNLIFRASYGQAATPFNGDFNYLSNYAGAGAYDGSQGLAPAFGNPDFDWEYTNTTNIGVDVAFWNRRARVKLDVYDKKTRNLVLQQRLSATSGFPGGGNVNAGSMYNKGIETEVSVDVISNRDITWTLGANLGYNKNKITSLGSVNEFPQGTAIIRVGLPFGAHYLPKWAGVDPATGNPQYYNLDGTITTTYNRATQSAADFGSWVAPLTGGFSSSFNFHNFYVEAFFSFAKGGKRFNNEDFFNENVSFATSNQSSRVFAERWRKAGDITDIQRYTARRDFSSKDIQDASYIRFRNLNVGYNFPSNIISRIKFVSSISIYVQAQNLATFTKWRGFDPEDNNNIAAFEYPQNKVVTGGVKIDF